MRTGTSRARIAVVAAGCLAASVLGAASATAADDPRPADRRPAGPRPVDPRPVDPRPVDPGAEPPRPDPRPGHPRHPKPRHPKPRPGHGVVVVNGIPMDVAPGRLAHTGCTFQVDFHGYFHGYGRGPRVAKVVFRTGKEFAPGGRRVLLADRVLLGEQHLRSPRLGPVSASRTYTLDMRRVHAGPKDRVPVVLTVVAPGSAGSAVKRAVYWVSGCAGAEPGPKPVEPVPVPPRPVPIGRPPVKPVPAAPVTDCGAATAGEGVCTTVVVSPSFTG